MSGEVVMAATDMGADEILESVPVDVSDCEQCSFIVTSADGDVTEIVLRARNHPDGSPLDAGQGGGFWFWNYGVGTDGPDGRWVTAVPWGMSNANDFAGALKVFPARYLIARIQAGEAGANGVQIAVRKVRRVRLP